MAPLMVATTIAPTWRATLRCIGFVGELVIEVLIKVGYAKPLDAPVASVELRGELPARPVVLIQWGANLDDAPGLLAAVSVMFRYCVITEVIKVVLLWSCLLVVEALSGLVAVTNECVE